MRTTRLNAARKFVQTCAVLVCATGLAGLSTSANAEANTNAQGWYAGISAGQSKINDFDNACTELLSILPLGSTCSSDGEDSGWKLGGGYRLNPNVALEAAYVNLGEGTFKVSGPGVGGDGGFETTGINLGAVGMLPLSPSFDLIGRFGLFLWDAELSISGVGGSFSDSASGTSLSIGVGAQFNFSKAFGIRVEWERFADVGDEDTTGQGDVDLLSAGVIISF